MEINPEIPEKPSSNFLNTLPSVDYYERSFMHKDLITEVQSSNIKNLIISISDDGVLKMWKKAFMLVDYIKTFKAHNGTINCAKFSSDHENFFTTSIFDLTVKVFDLNLFDIQKIIKLESGITRFVAIKSGTDYSDRIIGFSTNFELVEISEQKKTQKMKNKLVDILLVENHSMIITLDESSFIEYLDVDSWQFVTKKTNRVEFNSKFETDLFRFQKAKLGKPISMGKSNSGRLFWVITDSLIVNVFNTKSAKIITEINMVSDEVKDLLTKFTSIDKTEFSKKAKVEEEFLEKLKSDFKQKIKLDFDESETLLIFPTSFGIAIFDITQGVFCRLVGSREKLDLTVGICVFQGEKFSNNKGVIGSGGVSSQMKESDPLILSWCFKKQKFCLYSKRQPEVEVKKGESNPRDITNEKVRNLNEKGHKQATVSINQGVSKVVISTTLGDIHVKLFPQFAPRAVENFVTHAKKGYYDNCLFHRVVKGYIQGGDPLNDGTGGVSIWGGEFEDEFSTELTHDKPFTLSMANSGPDTNGSQFFITTIQSPWLDKRHTVFGRAYKGTEVVTEIESLKTDNFEKPLLDVRIFRIHPI